MLSFIKDVGVDGKEDQADVEDDPDDEDMKNAKLDDER